MSTHDPVERAEELLARLEAARGRLDTTQDPDAAIQVLGELAEIAKQVEAELERARQEANEDP